MTLISKQISNHPATGLERTVEIAGFTANDDSKCVDFYYRIEHSLGGVDIPVAVPAKEWRVDNSYLAVVRDEQFNPVPNPDFIPEYEIIGYTEEPEDWDEEENGEFIPQPIYGDKIVNEDDKWLRMPAFDYFKKLTFDNPNPVSIPLLLNFYIDDNDGKGFFDFY